MKRTIMSVAVAVCSVIVLASCGGNGLITKGNSSKLDTLSYALGANIGYGMSYEMSDIPFDFKAIANGINDAALEKADLTQEKAIELLRSYFMETRVLLLSQSAMPRKTASAWLRVIPQR